MHNNNPFAFLILLLCWSTALMETDIYVPCFPDMVVYFGITESMVQSVMSYNFLGFCITCLIYGPLSDSYGRKKMLIIGNAIFALAGIGCILTESFMTLCIWRLFQGMGAATIFSVGAAVFFDLYDESSAAAKLGAINTLIALIMAGAPVLGTWLNFHYGWRSPFILIAVQSIMCWIAVTFLFRESLAIEKRKPFYFGGIFKDYYTLLTSVRFICYNAAVCVLLACLVAYTANLSLIYVNYLGIKPSAYAYYQGAILLGFAAPSMLGGKLVEKIGAKKVCSFSTLCIAVGFCALYVVATLRPDAVLMHTIVMSITAAIMSLTMGAYGVVIMGVLPDIKGAAGSAMTVIRMLLTSAVVAITSVSFDGSMQALTSMLFLFSILALGCYYVAYKRDKRLQLEQDAAHQQQCI